MARAQGSSDPLRVAGRRRSQAERTAATRTQIVEAVFECIAEVGFARATAVEITRRAGVTWGAVQHHFGGKDGMLIAAVEDSFDHFAARFDIDSLEGVDLEERARVFVDGAWAHFRSREYRSAFEILMNYLGRDDLPDSESWRGEMFRAWDRVWTQIFGDSGMPRAERLALEHYALSVLAGLASTQMLAGAPARGLTRELDLLKATLVRELAF